VTNRRQTERTRLSTTSLRYSRTGGLINTNDIVFAIDAELLRLLQGGLGRKSIRSFSSERLGVSSSRPRISRLTGLICYRRQRTRDSVKYGWLCFEPFRPA
jgi:hypothetical protein